MVLREMDRTDVIKILEGGNGYRKVAHNGGCFVTATFYNPDTNDEYTLCVRDYDYSDCSRDIDTLYDMLVDCYGNTDRMTALFRLNKWEKVKIQGYYMA